MPSAAEVLGDDRLRFVLIALPDLLEPLKAALRPDLGDDVEARLEALAWDDPSSLGALQLVIVAGYYTDRQVRDLTAIPARRRSRSGRGCSGLHRGRTHRRGALAGPVWRDPATGQRAARPGAPRTYAERLSRATRRPKEKTMVAIAPDTAESAARAGWIRSSRPGSPGPARRSRIASRPRVA